MDQTPTFFSMLPTKILSPIGARTVYVQSSTSSTMRVTVSVCVTASGKMLPPLIIFKGKPNRRIKREFSRYNQGVIYAVQENAWMDERVMKIWIEKVLTPYAATAPQGIQPILLLDYYRCHQMQSVLQSIQHTGTDVMHIPAGCTGLCQPVDVGITKPMKDRVQNSWEDWMVDQGVETFRFNPHRDTLSKWIIESLQTLGEPLIRNSWRHGQFAYFEEEDLH